MGQGKLANNNNQYMTNYFYIRLWISSFKDLYDGSTTNDSMKNLAHSKKQTTPFHLFQPQQRGSPSWNFMFVN